MIIPINDLYRICSDEYQWIIQKKRNRKGKKDWASCHYYPTFVSAVRSLGELMVRQSKPIPWSPSALAEVENVATTLSQALTPTIEGLEHLKKVGSGQ